jgi:O-antigen/teichoic acid export membrane protein
MISAWVNKAAVRYKEDSFYRHALLFTVANLTASVINYAFYPLMGRLIGVQGYGELQIVTSFLLQLTTVFVGLNLINVNIFTNHDEHERKALMVALQKALFWLMVFLSVAVAIASPFLQKFFHFSSALPFLFIIPSLLIDAVSIFWTSYLQANRDFFSLSAYSIVTAGGKLLFAAGLVAVGVGVAGGVGGIALGLIAGLLCVRFTTRHTLPNLTQTLRVPSKHELTLIKSHLVYILEVIIALIGMSVLLSLDTMLVKHLFDADFAGQYAGVSTVARIIFFASSPIVTVMLPAISLRALRQSQAAFLRTIALSAGICAAGFAVFALFPHFILRIFLGEAFATHSNWLPLLALVAILVTLTNIIINYLLALRSHLAILISIFSVLVAGSLITWHHATVPQIVASACAGLVCGQLIFWAALIITKGRLGQATTEQ